jgi:hypothetical protein
LGAAKRKIKKAEQQLVLSPSAMANFEIFFSFSSVSCFASTDKTIILSSGKNPTACIVTLWSIRSLQETEAGGIAEFTGRVLSWVATRLTPVLDTEPYQSYQLLTRMSREYELPDDIVDGFCLISAICSVLDQLVVLAVVTSTVKYSV